MVKVHAERFVALLQFTARMELIIGNSQVHNEEAWGKLREATNDAAQTCEEMGLHLSAKTLRTLALILRSDSPGWPMEQQGYFRDAVSRVRDELSRITLLSLEPREETYFNPSEPLFGPDFAAKFPAQGAFELDEAAKCIAFGRQTAAVFHLMRLMEIGIRAVARCLNIPDPTRAADRNWGAILREIKNDFDAHVGAAPMKIWKIAGDKELFESASGKCVKYCQSHRVPCIPEFINSVLFLRQC
jgi:hypothetical protein